MVVVAAGGDEGGAGAGGGHLEAEHPAIEIECALQVGDLQVDVADADPGVDGGEIEHFFSSFGGHGSYLWLAGRGFDTHM
jgi:hypothetical protein